MTQAEVNIGLVGHVDHGKTTLTKSLSGVWTDKHSEEIKRGISIRLGYAEINIYKCPKCPEPDCYTTSEKCEKCGGKVEFIRKISFVDAPGHETLIATMLSGAALMDGVILVVAADEKCPQPQTIEHLLAIKTLGVGKIIVVQNKVDVVDKEKALENKKDIEALMKEFGIEAVIIPTAANYDINKDVVIAAIEQFIPTPERKKDLPARMSIARSFDINKPGDKADTLKGGVLGGSISQGLIKVGDEIEIRPGVKKIRKNAEVWEPVTAKVTALNSGDESFQELSPGGLVAVQTTLDPFMTKSDKLSGNVLGVPGTLPPTLREMSCEVTMLERNLGNVDIKVGEPLMLTVGTTNTVGVVKKQEGKGRFSMDLKLPVVASPGDRFAISKRVEMKWRLIGFGVVV